MIVNRNDAIPQPNHTYTMWKLRRARYTNASPVAKKFVLTYELGHHTHCLSLTQVTPGHVSEFLAVNTERVKSENPELKRYINIFILYLTG